MADVTESVDCLGLLITSLGRISPPLERDFVVGIPRDSSSSFNGTVVSDLVPSSAGMMGKDGQRHIHGPISVLFIGPWSHRSFCILSVVHSSHAVSLRKQLDSVFLSRGDVIDGCRWRGGRGCLI